MSAMGQKQTFRLVLSDVRFTPKSGHQLSALGCPLCAKSRHYESSLLDDLVRLGRKIRGHLDAERFGDLEVDDEFKFGGLGPPPSPPVSRP